MSRTPASTARPARTSASASTSRCSPVSGTSSIRTGTRHRGAGLVISRHLLIATCRHGGRSTGLGTGQNGVGGGKCKTSLAQDRDIGCFELRDRAPRIGGEALGISGGAGKHVALQGRRQRGGILARQRLLVGALAAVEGSGEPGHFL